MSRRAIFAVLVVTVGLTVTLAGRGSGAAVTFPITSRIVCNTTFVSTIHHAATSATKLFDPDDNLLVTLRAGKAPAFDAERCRRAPNTRATTAGPLVWERQTWMGVDCLFPSKVNVWTVVRQSSAVSRIGYGSKAFVVDQQRTGTGMPRQGIGWVPTKCRPIGT